MLLAEVTSTSSGDPFLMGLLGLITVVVTTFLKYWLDTRARTKANDKVEAVSAKVDAVVVKADQAANAAQVVATNLATNTADKLDIIHKAVNGNLGNKLRDIARLAREIADANPTPDNIARATLAEKAADEHAALKV